MAYISPAKQKTHTHTHSPYDGPVDSCGAHVQQAVFVFACDNARIGCCCCYAMRSEGPVDCGHCAADGSCAACPADGDDGAEHVLATPPSAWAGCG